MGQLSDESDRAGWRAERARFDVVEQRLSQRLDNLQEKVDALKDSMRDSRLSMEKEVTKLALLWAITAYIGGFALLALGSHCLGSHPSTADQQKQQSSSSYPTTQPSPSP